MRDLKKNINQKYCEFEQEQRIRIIANILLKHSDWASMYVPSLCIWNCSDGVWDCNILLDTVVAVTLVTATLLVDIFNICDIPVLKASWNCVVLALVELIPVAPYIASI